MQKRFIPILFSISVLFSIAILWQQSGVQSASAQGAEKNHPFQITSVNWPQRAPEFHGSAKDWINTNGKQLQFQHGKVYLIDFWEYTCVNCLRTLPYLKEWNTRYSKDGLVIVGIHTPEFAFAHNYDNVLQAVKRLGISWPVLVDSQYENWNAYRNSYWPRDYFVDANGNIVADHAGEGDYENAERTIQNLLLRAHPSLRFPGVLKPIRSTDVPGAVCYPMTAETYCGARGYQSGVLGNISGWIPGAYVALQPPSGALADGVVYPVGHWITEEESLRHSRKTDGLPDYIEMRYHAITLNAVIRPYKGATFPVYIDQDGNPVPRNDKGEDLLYNSEGKSYIYVNEPRMYQIIRNKKFGSHVISMASPSPDFDLYSFTFTSCTSP